MWNVEAGYEDWYTSPKGSVALEAQHYLLRQMIFGWPRRGHNLLEINCAGGHFLETFFESGLDVTGHEGNQDLVALTRARMGQRAELVLGSPESLPFEDSSFSYVACLNWLENCLPPSKNTAQGILHEVFRLAERGLLLGFYNRFSLAGVLERSAWAWPTRIASMIRKECKQRSGCRMSWGSTLLFPRIFWGKNYIQKATGNSKISPLWTTLPIGAYVIVRVDLDSDLPLTSIPLRAQGLETA